MIQAARPEHADWLRERTGYRLGGDWRGIVALDERGVVLGLVAYDGWTLNAVQMHVALDTPLIGRALLRPAFAYPFLDVGVGLVLATIAAANTRSLGLARYLGFRDLYRIQDGWADGVDLLLLGMRREQCRWLREKGAAKKAVPSRSLEHGSSTWWPRPAVATRTPDGIQGAVSSTWARLCRTNQEMEGA